MDQDQTKDLIRETIKVISNAIAVLVLFQRPEMEPQKRLDLIYRTLEKMGETINDDRQNQRNNN